MKRICITLAGLSLTAVAMGGCASRAVEARLDNTRYNVPAMSTTEGQPMMAHLGAGDQLGSAIFVQYLASIQTDQAEHFATGTLDAPETD